MRAIAAAAALMLLLRVPAAAQPEERSQPGLKDPIQALEHAEPEGAEPAEPALEVMPRQKMTFGENGYLAGDTSVLLSLPLDFSADLGYSFYQTDDSSATHTLAFGAGKEWDERSVGFTYMVTPWSNDYRSDAVNVKATVRAGPRHLRTTLGADVTITHHSQVMRGSAVSQRLDVTQRTPTVSARQRLWDTQLSVDLSESVYNKDVTAISRVLAIASLRRPRIAASIGNAAGLTQGFQDRSMRFGVSHDVEIRGLPVTAWAAYESTHFVDTFQALDAGVVFVQGQTADSQSYGLDAELTRLLDASIGFNRVRQTNFPTRDYFSFALGLRL